MLWKFKIKWGGHISTNSEISSYFLNIGSEGPIRLNIVRLFRNLGRAEHFDMPLKFSLFFSLWFAQASIFSWLRHWSQKSRRSKLYDVLYYEKWWISLFCNICFELSEYMYLVKHESETTWRVQDISEQRRILINKKIESLRLDQSDKVFKSFFA
jgi:hypothetical protein